MPRGGKRLGSGRKPLTRQERWLGGNASKRPLAVVRASMGETAAFRKMSADDADELRAPEFLTDGEKAYWSMCAPLALRRGMLTVDTRLGLAELCKVAMRASAMWAEIEARGFVHEITIQDSSGQERHELKKHPLIPEWRGLVKQTELLMSRFGLTGDGKIVVAEEKPDDERAKLARILAG